MSSRNENPKSTARKQPQGSATPAQQKAAELDPEIILRRKFRAKCLFRALYRLVCANLYWLSEDEEHYEGLDDVKRRVQQAIRKKTKKKQLLSIQDKALLNKNAKDRTESEKKYIYRIIGGLKCFKRYPNHVKKKLAAVTYFKYYGPDRVIVRQNQEAHALYFIVTGEVCISHLVYDELLQKMDSTTIGVMHAGDLFGEVSLLNNIPRTATVTTTGHCELLVLLKEDFKSVLQASIQKSWDQVRLAMSAFTYFEALDEVALREGCIVAKMKSYSVGETILGDGVGVPNFVYFTLSGKCQMIETLDVIITPNLQNVCFTLYDPYIKKEESIKELEEKYFKGYKNLTETSEESQLKAQSETLEESQTTRSKSHSVQISKEKVVELSNAVGNSTRTSARLSKLSTRSERRSEMLKAPRDEESRPSIKISLPSNKVPKTKKFFMQVGFFNPGSTFGFGENMRDRRIVALTNVDCMLLPKVWLLQRNTANIWTRIQYYLDKKLPTKAQLFKEFVEQHRWMKFKDQLVDDVVSRHNPVNWTSPHDIPYFIRMNEVTSIQV